MQYQYKHLEPDEIRLLELHGGDEDSQLTAIIHCFRLPEDSELLEHQEFVLTRAEGITVPNAPSFQALSYTWGAESKDQPLLTVLEGGRLQEIRLQDNLHAALCRLRRDIATDQSRMFWIDALCINQSDISEKNVQTQKMAMIYNRADSVTVWLGEEDGDSAKAMSFINRVKDLDVFDPLIQDPEASPEWAALMNLMQRRWFSRRWIVQELALARNAVMYCGNESVSWRDFSCAVSLFTSRHLDLRLLFQKSQRTQHHPNFIGEVDALGAKALVDITNNLFRKTKDGKILERLLSLEALLCTLTAFESTLPHDAIYSVLWLAYDAEPVGHETQAMAHEALLRTPDHSPRLEAVSTPETDVSDSNGPGIASPARSVTPSIIVSEAEDVHDSTSHDPPSGVPLEHARRVRYHSGRAATDNSLRIAEHRFENNPKRILVDYKLSFFEVCTQFLDLTISQSRSLDILCHPWAPEPQRTHEPLLPSWICSLKEAPFDKEPTRNAYGRVRADPLVGNPGKGPRNYNACGKTKAFPSTMFIVDRTFLATGFVVDVVGTTKDTAHEGIIPHSWLEFAGWSDAAREAPDQFWRLLVADRGPGGQQQPPAYFWLACKWVLEQKKRRGGINTAELLSSGKCPSIAAEFLRRAQSVVWGRRIMLSRGRKGGGDRFIGLVPEHAEPGDLICVLYGCSVPVLLRRSRKRKSESRSRSSLTSSLVQPRKKGSVRPPSQRLLSPVPDGKSPATKVRTSTRSELTVAPEPTGTYLNAPTPELDVQFGSVNVHNKLLSQEASGSGAGDQMPRKLSQHLGPGGAGERQFTLIGPCYIQNLMDGEGFKHQHDHGIKNEVFRLT